MKYHNPVLLNEVIEGLNVKPGGRYIDMTVGGGGHTAVILAKGGIVLGIDRDPEAISEVTNRFRRELENHKLFMANDNFENVTEIVKANGFEEVKGILFDLGMSSHQVDASGHGFSFQRNEPLDMRMDPKLTVTAADLINGLGRKELFELFVKFGQVDRAKTAVEAILAKRKSGKISTTGELAEIVEKEIPRRGSGRTCGVRWSYV